MPTKLFDGLTVFCHVSRDTAIPLIPENPSPPPFTPRAVGCGDAGVGQGEGEPVGARARTDEGVEGGRDADPRHRRWARRPSPPASWWPASAAGWAATLVVLSWAVPLSCQPPDTGEGIEPGGGPAV